MTQNSSNQGPKIALFEPDIPQNTAAIIRTCACLGAKLEIIKPCGLSPKKSKAIAELSKILCKEYKGEVPESFEALEALPGVGHKTAAVVMSQGFNHPAFPVDTHIHRLAQRWRLSKGKNVKQTEKDLKKGFPMDDWNRLHLRIIYYGREHCTARGCDGRVCFICSEINKGRKSPIITNKA